MLQRRDMVTKGYTRGKEKTETSLMGEVGDNFIPEEMMEYEIK